MLSRWTIRKKLQIAMAVLGLVIAALGYSSFRGVYAYKELVGTLSSRASEIPLTAELTRAIDDLRLDKEPTQTREVLSFSLQDNDASSNYTRPPFSDRL